MIINIITKQRPSRHFNNKIMERLRKQRLGKIPPGLLAQVVSSHLSDFKLRGSSPCVNIYPAKKKKRLGKMITQKQRFIYIYLTLNLEVDTGHLAWSTTLTHSFQLA